MQLPFAIALLGIGRYIAANTADPHIEKCARVGFAFGAITCHMRTMTGTYSKPFLSIADQLVLLRQRGLSVNDQDAASLTEYGYYRVSGYSHPLRIYDPANGSQLDQFHAGADMAHVAALIEFDRGLRSLFLLAAERIEVAVRVQVAILLGQRDPWAHRDPQQFFPKFSKQIDPKTARIPFNDWITRLDDIEASSKEDFAEHFRKNYNNPPPIWVSIELWNFGLLSKMIGGMNASDQKDIGLRFGIPRRGMFASLIRSINHVRNIAAHHSRLWNRSPSDQPSPPRLGEIELLDHLARDAFAQFRLYGVVAPTQFLLKQINPIAAALWAEQLKAHFATFPEVPGLPFTLTGFPKGWETEALWN